MATNRRQSRELRIIAGSWRGRRLRFPAGPQIRPTPDRVRETLFNWLAPYVRGARVLDLFAGSGALGLEALSRGAAHARFVDVDLRAITALRELLVEWRVEAGRAEAMRGDALAMLDATPPAAFDIVFIDPPFAAGLWQAVATRLERNDWLSPEAFVYLEAPLGQSLEGLPAGWLRWRESTAGEVGYHLLRRAASGGGPSDENNDTRGT